MKSFCGHYSIVQYCPDAARYEGANVGVVVFCPELEFIRAKMSPTNDRVRQFFGSDGFDWIRMDAIKQGLAHRVSVETPEIRTLAQFQQFAAMQANLLVMTPPRPMRIDDPEADLDRLYERVVATPRRGESAVSDASSNGCLAESTTNGSHATMMDETSALVPSATFAAPDHDERRAERIAVAAE